MKRFFDFAPRLSDDTPDGRDAKRMARTVLQTDGLRLHLIWAALLCLILGVGGLYLVENTFAVVPWVSLYQNTPAAFHALNALYTLIDVAYTVLIIFPVAYGAATVFEAAARTQRRPLGSLFDAFSCAGRYWRSVAVVSALALPRLLALGLLTLLARTALGATTLIGTLLWGLLALIVLAGAALLLGLDDAFLPLSIRDGTTGLMALYRTSLRLCAPRLGRILRFKLGFALWALASVFSLGVLLLAHALPYYALTHAAWADTYYLEQSCPCGISPYGKDG